MRRKYIIIGFLILLLPGSFALAAKVNVAVASNFVNTLRQLAEPFSRASGHELIISSASTGKLYAQILHGAPYDLFLAADEARPQRLLEQGYASRESLFTYAVGRLVLWSPLSHQQSNGARLLADGGFQHLAIGNPRTAPYGKAAQQALKSLGLWERLQDRLVRGENIGQAFQFVATGAAELGLVALSQLQDYDSTAGYRWLVPTERYTPIRQQGVLLERSRKKPEAVAFADFLTSAAASRIIRANGYLLDGEEE